MITREQIDAAWQTVRTTLLEQRVPSGHWEGELSSSALSTATAVVALSFSGPKYQHLIQSGLDWLIQNQNSDGGWGDTTKSFSNISTTMLCYAAFKRNPHPASGAAMAQCEQWLSSYGSTPEELAEAIRARYGKDRTFSVPILMMAALANLISWREVPRLPFELAALPSSWYRFARLPVVSYALPALIAIGQTVQAHRGSWNPISSTIRWWCRNRTLRKLRTIQPTSGGYLEATPLTSFVVMSLASLPYRTTDSEAVMAAGLQFLEDSVRPDGSWPIDTNLAIWVTTLSVNALAAGNDLPTETERAPLFDWIADQQTRTRHPYTDADPGGWGWTDFSGSVPDADDTPGAWLALMNLDANRGVEAIARPEWLLNLQNTDGGWPTFCRGWGTLPFDRSGADLTAHAIRALNRYCQLQPNSPHASRMKRAVERGFRYLARQQAADGSWLPLWFGNQHAPDDINPVYGTSRVLACYLEADGTTDPAYQRGVAFLMKFQNSDGGWGGAANTPSTVEETALALDVLVRAVPTEHPTIQNGYQYLLQQIAEESWTTPSPIGFYFAKLWYFEKMYPLVYVSTAIGRLRILMQSSSTVPG
ncbi:MAG: prenyltransferase/squalene oxidase repeat-containing protein [Zavarzinella sp.]